MRIERNKLGLSVAVVVAAFAACSPSSAQTRDAEISFWNSVKDSKDVDELEAYLNAYPNDQFAPIAKIRLKKLDHADSGDGRASDRPTAAKSISKAEKQGRAPVHDCDRLAANPYDPERVTEGVGDSGFDAARTVDACRKARKAHPHERRFAYQLARALYQKGDYETAARLFQTLAEDGYEIAMVHLSFAYERGNGVSQDFKKVAYWYRKAVALGNPIAMTNLGDMYWHGRGVPVDLAESLRLTRKAAKLGRPRAMANMGVKYQLGKGVKKDVTEALRWHERAAEFGEAAAYYNLALVLGRESTCPRIRAVPQAT